MLGLFFYKDRANLVFCSFCCESSCIKKVLTKYFFIKSNIKECTITLFYHC